MSIYNWAERECRIACKKENPTFNFDSDDFDYGCSCYKSALKAYKSLCEDGHSGMSFSFTKNILIRLMEDKPLTPITDEDFFSVERGTEAHPLEVPKYLAERGLKSRLQCPRMFSLFREETLDGKVTYYDVDRAYNINIEEESDTYQSWTGFLDEMFPITMPYMPKRGKYKIYEQTFLTDPKNGDFDTKGILYVITPEGERVDVGIYRAEKGGKMVEITKEEYEERLARRVDPLSKKVATHLMWTLISNSGRDSAIAAKEEAFRAVPDEVKEQWYQKLDELCKFFDNPDNYKYNTFNIRQDICRGQSENYKDVPELVEITGYLKSILDEVMTYSKPVKEG